MEQKKLSEMTEQEIRHEIQGYKEKMRKAESYLVDRDKVQLGRIYKLNDGSEGYFKVERLKGVFAWGYRINSNQPEEGLPLALLQI